MFSTTEDRSKWRVVAFGDAGAAFFRFADGDAARAWLGSSEIFDEVPGLDGAHVCSPDGWEPARPRFLPIYGESDKDRAVRDLRFSPSFGRWLTRPAQLHRFEDLLEWIDRSVDPSGITLDRCVRILAREPDEGECDPEELADIAFELREAIDDWFPMALRTKGIRVNADEVRNHECLTLVTPIRDWPTMAGVYFVRAADRVKIGKANNVERRLRELQTSAPHALELLAVAQGGLAEEAAYHYRFKADRLHGEWFTFSAALVAHVVELRTGGAS